jgi:hypothetical protein
MQRPIFLATHVLGWLALNSAPVLADDWTEEEATGPPGSVHIDGGALWAEKVNEDDPDSTRVAPLFIYRLDGSNSRGAFLFVHDEDWCRNALFVRLDLDASEEQLAACLEWVEASPFSADNLVLPETWAVRIAGRAGWLPDRSE